MQIYYPVQTRITPLTTLHWEALLPTPGEVLVRPGGAVAPDDVVARCRMPGRIWTVDLSSALGVSRGWAVRHLNKAIGDVVQRNELLAQTTRRLGRAQRRCLAPTAGRLAAVRNGVALIEAPASTFELRAQLRGQVDSILPGRGVMISTPGALIQGVWSSGDPAIGRLRMLVRGPQEPLEVSSLEEDCAGTLVVGGQLLDKRVLRRAAETQVRGMIVGGLEAELCRLLPSLPYPVLVTEGFGPLPMGQQAFTLLQSCAGFEALISAGIHPQQTLSRAGRRPEVLIPLGANGAPSAEGPGALPLRVGMQVRGLRAPYLGALGMVTGLPPSPQEVESGASLPVAQVDLEEWGAKFIPLANLELIR